MSATPRTVGVEPLRCVWHGGGYSIWLMRADGAEFYRLGHAGNEWLGDYPTNHEATKALAQHAKVPSTAPLVGSPSE